jgi:carboxylate-amine ligase
MPVVARRLLTCGKHVHIGIDDDDLRIELLN